MWKIPVRPGDTVAAGATLVVVESMKMEIAIGAPVAGKVLDVLCREGGTVAAGHQVVLLKQG